MALPLPVLNALLRTEALGVAVAPVAGKGRGVVATRALAAGTRLALGAPLAHSAAPPYALPAPSAAPGAGAAFARAASRAAADLAADAAVGARRHPILVAQVACRVALEPAGGAFPVVFASLCAARAAGGPTPDEWRADAAAVRRALAAADVDASFVSDAWYVGVLSRVHLNAMRARRRRLNAAVSGGPRASRRAERNASGDPSRAEGRLRRSRRPRPLGSRSGCADETSFAPPQADAAGTATAVFGLASFFNHGRDPTALADYGAGAFAVARPLDAGAELTIDYVHDRRATDDAATTAAFLRDNYGFAEDPPEEGGPG